MVSKWVGFAAGGMLCHSDKDHVPYWDPTEMHFPIYVLELDVTTGPAVEVRLYVIMLSFTEKLVGSVAHQC